jgi:hypothetical protein
MPYVATRFCFYHPLALSFALYFRFLGFVRSLQPQHGRSPSYLMNISLIWHLFFPLAYQADWLLSLLTDDGCIYLYKAIWSLQPESHLTIIL